MALQKPPACVGDVERTFDEAVYELSVEMPYIVNIESVAHSHRLTRSSSENTLTCS